MAEIISLGQRLRERREELGISQAQAARDLDVARTAYRLWELEAARPSSDRWRALSKWLGISVTAILLAEKLTEAGEADDVEQITRRLGHRGAMDWESTSALEPGDYFSQERSTIAKQTRLGSISVSESDRLANMLDRIQSDTGSRLTAVWQPAEFHKELLSSSAAVEEARAALAVTASGIPTDSMKRADALIAALVVDVVDRVDELPSILELHIEVGRRMLRVAASDRPETDREESDGWRFVMEHSSRWGATGRAGARVRWFELDLPEPGWSAPAGASPAVT